MVSFFMDSNGRSDMTMTLLLPVGHRDYVVNVPRDPWSLG